MVDIALTNVEATVVIRALEDYADRLVSEMEWAETPVEEDRLGVHLTLVEDVLDVFNTNLAEAQHEPAGH